VPEVTVYDNKNRAVGAKILRDANGRPILEPSTGFPLIVDEDFDIERAIAFGRALANVPVDRSSDYPHWEKMSSIYTLLFNAFEDGGPLEMQRSYNKKVGGGQGEFVKAFQPAASYIYGLVARAAGLSPQEIVGAAGLYNWSRKYIKGNNNINTSGSMFNAPRNVPWMEQGIRAYDSGSFSAPSSRSPSGTDQTPQNQTAPAEDSILDGQPPPRQEQPPVPMFADLIPQPAGPQLKTAGEAPAYRQVDSTGGPGLPQHVIDTGNYLRANGYEITPRTMYVSHVLGPQAAVDLFKRTGSTASPAVPSPDQATGDQMRAWVRALRLGPAAQAGLVGALAPAPAAGAATPDQPDDNALAVNRPFA
jgi:hypothetical protein